MDRAYKDEATRQAALDSGFIPVVPPKKNRRFPWEYDKELYKRRNEIEGYFRRLKRFRKGHSIKFCVKANPVRQKVACKAHGNTPVHYFGYLQ